MIVDPWSEQCLVLPYDNYSKGLIQFFLNLTHFQRRGSIMSFSKAVKQIQVWTVSHSGVFMGPLVHGPLWQKKFIFSIGKKYGLAPFVYKH